MRAPLPWTDGNPTLDRPPAAVPGDNEFPGAVCANPPRTTAPGGIRLEQRQVVLDLPRRDLLVVGVPLVLLGLHVVIDVVLGARVAERGPDDLVLLEVPGGVEQVRGQEIDLPPLELALVQGVEVVVVGRPRVDVVLDP